METFILVWLILGAVGHSAFSSANLINKHKSTKGKIPAIGFINGAIFSLLLGPIVFIALYLTHRAIKVPDESTGRK